jgi:hypothetical protein
MPFIFEEAAGRSYNDSLSYNHSFAPGIFSSSRMYRRPSSIAASSGVLPSTDKALVSLREALFITVTPMPEKRLVRLINAIYSGVLKNVNKK